MIFGTILININLYQTYFTGKINMILKCLYRRKKIWYPNPTKGVGLRVYGIQPGVNPRTPLI